MMIAVLIPTTSPSSISPFSCVVRMLSIRRFSVHSLVCVYARAMATRRGWGDQIYEPLLLPGLVPHSPDDTASVAHLTASCF